MTANDEALTSIRIQPLGCGPSAAPQHPVLREGVKQMSAWLSGKTKVFDLPLTGAGGAEAEHLRAAIAAIPYGQTRTYGAVAETCGSIARAVGQACKTNRFPIIIPCHRVVSTAGPEYYSAGQGPRTKTWLIDFEYGNLPADQRTRLI